MINLKPGQPDPEILAFQRYNPADGLPPLNDLEVQLGEIQANDLKNPDQREVALKALQARDRRSFHAVVENRAWKPEKKIAEHEAPGYADKIDRIRNLDTRKRARTALRERDRARLEQLLSEKD